MTTALPDGVLVREVGPRDGFQNDPERIADLEALLAAGRDVQAVLGRPLGSHVLTAGPVVWNG